MKRKVLTIATVVLCTIAISACQKDDEVFQSAEPIEITSDGLSADGSETSTNPPE